MKFQVTDRIQTNASATQLLDALENQFKRKSESQSRIGDAIRVNSIEASFGSINRSDKTDITVRPADGGYLMVADVKYRPSVWFWVILIVTLFTYVLWLVPIVFYLIQKKTVKEGIEDCFRNTINEFGAAPNAGAIAGSPSSTQSSIADLERLAGMLQQGLITQAEFDAHKAKLFGIVTVPTAARFPTPNAQTPPPVPQSLHQSSNTNGRAEQEAETMFDEAKMHVGNGDKELAVKVLRMLIERFPDTNTAARARRSLAPKPKA